MKLSDLVWGVLGLAAIGLGVVEWGQGKTLLSLSGFVIGAVLIGATVAALRNKR